METLARLFSAPAMVVINLALVVSAASTSTPLRACAVMLVRLPVIGRSETARCAGPGGTG